MSTPIPLEPERIEKVAPPVPSAEDEYFDESAIARQDGDSLLYALSTLTKDEMKYIIRRFVDKASRDLDFDIFVHFYYPEMTPEEASAYEDALMQKLRDIPAVRNLLGK